MVVRTVLDRLRQPEYTGENRCVPCTAVNVVIAVALALAVVAGVRLTAGSSLDATLAGAVVFATATAAIYLRGYLVPGTPRLTRTYFPEWVLRRFDKAPAGEASFPSASADSDTGSADTDADADGFDDEEVETALRRAGAVTECADGDDLCLTDEFRAAWHEATESRRGTDVAGLTGDLAALLAVDPADLTVREHGDAWSARVDGQRVCQWESRGAVLADAAAAAELRERRPDAWAATSVGQRGRLVRGLRVFLDRCPSCDGAVEFGEETVSSCCRSANVLAVTCRDCGARLFETDKLG